MLLLSRVVKDKMDFSTTRKKMRANKPPKKKHFRRILQHGRRCAQRRSMDYKYSLQYHNIRDPSTGQMASDYMFVTFIKPFCSVALCAFMWSAMGVTDWPPRCWWSLSTLEFQASERQTLLLTNFSHSIIFFFFLVGFDVVYVSNFTFLWGTILMDLSVGIIISCPWTAFDQHAKRREDHFLGQVCQPDQTEIEVGLLIQQQAGWLTLILSS